MIDINTRDFVRLANNLEKIGKYDLPVVARQTLNELAFRMKGVSGKRGRIDIEAQRQFDYQRNRALFRAFTGVQKSSGNNLNSMSSQAGIIERAGREKLARGLAQQQEGGSVESGSTPTYQSRVGGQLKGKVRTKNYMKRLAPVDLTRNKGKRFNVRAHQAIKNDRAIIFRSRSGVSYVAKIKKFDNNARYKYDMDILFRLNKGRVPLQKKRPFVNDAAKGLMNEGPEIFSEKAEARIKKSFERR